MLPSPLSKDEIFMFFAAYPHKREFRVVGEHAIAAPGVWEKQVGPAILKVLDEDNVQWNTIDVHRIHYVDFDESPFPVVVCIGAKLGTLSGEDGARVAKRCQVLDDFGLSDVEVAIKASERFQSAAPPFEKPARRAILETDPIAKLRMPFTSTVGFPLSTVARPDVEGSSGSFFTNGEDTSKVYLLTARHVVLETTTRDENTAYNKSSARPRRQNVTIFGEKGIVEHMKSIRVELGSQSRLADIYRRQVNVAQDRSDKTQGQDEAKELERIQRQLATVQEAVKALETIYVDVAKLYLPEVGRILGFVSYSPPISLSLGEHKYTEDVAVIEVDTNKIDTNTFLPNVLDLGFEYKLWDLTRMMNPRDSKPEDTPLFEYPIYRLLKLHGIISDAELRDPQQRDSNGDRCIMVLKRGRTTGLTVGRLNNVASYTRTYWKDGTSDISTERPIFNYGYDMKGTRVFSEPGDSGSVVVDGKGRIAGIITGGAGFRPTSDVTYMMPAEFIHKQMLTRGIDMNVNFTLKA